MRRARRGARYLNPCQEEAIVINQRLLNSTVSSPPHIERVSGPTFEQTIEFQVLGEDGGILGQGYTTIEDNFGERGPFAVDIEFTPPATGEQGRMVVFATSARDYDPSLLRGGGPRGC